LYTDFLCVLCELCGKLLSSFFDQPGRIFAGGWTEMNLRPPSGPFLQRPIYQLGKYHLDQVRNPWGKGTLNIREKIR
jgi:hypothetical protein